MTSGASKRASPLAKTAFAFSRASTVVSCSGRAWIAFVKLSNSDLSLSFLATVSLSVETSLFSPLGVAALSELSGLGAVASSVLFARAFSTSAIVVSRTFSVFATVSELALSSESKSFTALSKVLAFLAASPCKSLSASSLVNLS